MSEASVQARSPMVELCFVQSPTRLDTIRFILVVNVTGEIFHNKLLTVFLSSF